MEQDDNFFLNELKNYFEIHHSNKENHHSISNFKNELDKLNEYINRNDINIEKRSKDVGIAFGIGFICVNTKILKNILKRCKSSINHGLQLLGYTAIKSKIKSQTMVSTILPSLSLNIENSRKWTTRIQMIYKEPKKIQKMIKPIVIPLINQKIENNQLLDENEFYWDNFDFNFSF